MFKIELSPKVGRYLKAVHDIEPGTIIIDEPSIVDGPCVDKSSSSTFSSGGCPRESNGTRNAYVYVCPACYKKLPEVDTGHVTTEPELLTSHSIDTRAEQPEMFANYPVNCPKCHLILCSTKCTASQVHAKNECLVFSKLPALLKQVFQHPSKRNSLCQFITTSRCLFLKNMDRLKWDQLMQLQSNCKEFEEHGIFEEVDEGFSLLSWNLFHSGESDCEGGEDRGSRSAKESENADIDIMDAAHTCLGILRTNAFSQMTNEIGVERLFFFSSFMAHDCLMNTDRYFCSPNEDAADPSQHGSTISHGRMITKAAVKIRQGESITTTYMSFLASTPERQSDMGRVWMFHCTCPRCESPTECETNLSTMKCPNCSIVCLSASYCTEDKVCKWLCSNPSCDYRINEAEIQGLLGSTVVPIEAARPELTNTEDTELWLDARDNGQELHTNHSVFLQVKYYLCQYYGSGTGNEFNKLSSTRLLRKIKYCKHALDVLNRLFNGVYLFKGAVLFHLWLALKEVSSRQLELEANEADENLADENSINKTAKEAYDILRHGDPNSMEELMANVLLCDDAKLFQSFDIPSQMPSR